jgi:hypothetical protein
MASREYPAEERFSREEVTQMGMMPNDREERWKEITRRFGIPGRSDKKAETATRPGEGLREAADSLLPEGVMRSKDAKKGKSDRAR